MPANDNVASGRWACARIKPESGDDIILYEITGWTMSVTADDINYVSCETDGLRRRVDGNVDATGTLSGVFRIDQPITNVITENTIAVLKLFVRKPTVGVAGLYHEVPVKILSIEETADIEGPAVHRWTANWVLHTTEDDPALLRNQAATALSAT